MSAAETPSNISTSAGEIGPWLRLHQAPGVGPVAARKLLAAFGLPEQVFSASRSQLRAVVPDALARALLAPPDAACAALIDRTRDWLAEPGHAALTLADAGYPPLLLELPDPPLLLHAAGDPALLARPALAIVGSRNASAQGARDAAQFAETLCTAGLTIVSGLARGIDACAHQGALKAGAPAATVAVIGTGCDLVYPSRHRALSAEIAARGCVISEYPLGTPPLAANFPRRNRLIAGLARAVLVVEAAERSGSLITARLAAEQGRDVFALPGSIHAPLARGCHRLIKEGARLTETAQEILEELGLASPGPDRRPAPAADGGLLDFAPADFDTLAARSGLPAAALNAALLRLELDGQAERLPDGKYRRLH